MSNHAKKKEKHRLKRLAKQRQLRKGAMTPLQRICKHGGKVECSINVGWEVQGLADIQVFGTAPDGRHALCVFLVDLFCVGLKDTFGRVEISLSEYEEQKERMKGRMIMVPIGVEKVRKMVAGAVRFSRQNGFKLPRNWEKWTAILGDLGDIASADLSGFGKDGGLLFIGDERFLRERLIGCTPDEFFTRPNVHFMMQVPGPAAEWLDDEEEEDYEDEDDADVRDDENSFAVDDPRLKVVTDPLVKQTAAWCQEHGLELHPLCEPVAAHFTLAMIDDINRYGQTIDEDAKERVLLKMLQSLERSGHTDGEELLMAFGQICNAQGANGIMGVVNGTETPEASAVPEPMPREFDMPVPKNDSDEPDVESSHDNAPANSPSESAVTLT